MAETPIGLDAIETLPLHEQVYRRLTRALMAGKIEPGRKLTTRKLARELGTSDMPVRAALARLQAVHALTALPNGSLILPPMSRERFMDLSHSRAVCEGAAAEQAAGHIAGSELRAIRIASAALTQAAKDDDIEAYLEMNYEFKFCVYRSCQSESLTFLIETLWLQVGPFLRQFNGKFDGALEGILELDYHEEIVDALTKGDGAEAGRLIRADILEGAEVLAQHGEFV